VAKARRQALAWGEGASIVFWQNFPDGHKESYTEDVELKVKNGRLVKTKELLGNAKAQAVS
jgi:hypothetical protein